MKAQLSQRDFESRVELIFDSCWYEGDFDYKVMVYRDPIHDSTHYVVSNPRLRWGNRVTHHIEVSSLD